MAADPPHRRRDTALGVVGAAALGAIAASAGGPYAFAAGPDGPSWSEVQRAKADERAADSAAARITGQLGELQDRADTAGRRAAIAAERFHRARLVEDDARDRHTALAAEADAAQRVARTSRMRAGLLAASVARGGGGLDLMLDAPGADDLLHRLAAVAQLSAQSQAVYEQALADEHQAEALGDQADAAAAVLDGRAADAQEALETAQRSAATTADAVTAEHRHEERLLTRLAELHGTSVRVAARYVAALRASADERREASRGDPSGPAAPAAGIGAPEPGASPSGPSAGGTVAAPGPAAATVRDAPARPTEAEPVTPPAASAAPPPASPPPGSLRPSAPASSAAPRAPEPVEPRPLPRVPVVPVAGPPNTARAASAVAFARDQIGDPYRFGGAGPDAWDCSGLSSAAYASAGLAIGGHSATAQYRLAEAQGRLVPFAQVQTGDLVFYTDDGGDMYHVALASGSGLMIEAPYPGTTVREVPIRRVDRAPQVARPTAG